MNDKQFFVEFNPRNESHEVKHYNELKPIAICPEKGNAEGLCKFLNNQSLVNNLEYDNSKELYELLGVVKEYKNLPERVIIAAIENVYQTDQKRMRKV